MVTIPPKISRGTEGRVRPPKDQPSPAADLLARIAVEAAEEVVAVIGDQDSDKAQHKKHCRWRAPPPSDGAGMQIGAVHEQGHERASLLRVPSPVPTPGDVGPKGAEYQDESHEGKANRDSPIADVVERFQTRECLNLK